MKRQNIKKTIIENKYLIIVSALALVLVYVIIYLLRHKSSYVSIDITEVNNLSAQLVSVLSLIIVSAVSLSIGVYSNKKNSERQLLERKMEAIDNLYSYLPSISLASGSYIHKIEDYNRKVQKGFPQFELEENKKTILKEAKPLYVNVNLLHLYLKHFPHRYSHLFNNEFNSENYMKAVVGSKYLFQTFENYIAGIEGLAVTKNNLKEEDNYDIVEYTSAFAEELKEELV